MTYISCTHKQSSRHTHIGAAHYDTHYNKVILICDVDRVQLPAVYHGGLRWRSKRVQSKVQQIECRYFEYI
jgi:aspartyl/asparaginyl beta-hydroxylase (cupin superfamily)